ncbi:hypothetical protein MTX35_25430, partial [Rhodococcus sp. ARC_M12]|uniref:hypothetical protein n=1 Tax=Rhodococcus sp. ARC_M12 TaxID=2928854 RepID=UPI001FB4EA48
LLKNVCNAFKANPSGVNYRKPNQGSGIAFTVDLRSTDRTESDANGIYELVPGLSREWFPVIRPKLNGNMVSCEIVI